MAYIIYRYTYTYTYDARRGYSESTNTDKQQAQRQVPYHPAVGLNWLCATPTLLLLIASKVVLFLAAGL